MAARSTPTTTPFSVLNELFSLEETVKVEVKKEEPESDEKVGAGLAEEVSSASDVLSPAAKRRRRLGSLVGTAVGKGTPTKTPAAEEAKAKKACTGCGRLRGGSCFRIAGQKVVWLYPDERGAFCIDCHTVWRLAFEKTHTLSLFAAWLTADPVNLVTFQIYLLAKLSFGDVPSIGREALEARVEMLQWFASMMGIPLQAFRVELLAADGLPEDLDCDSRRLVPVETADGLRWGVLQPQAPDFAAFRDWALRRPFFSQWTSLPTTTPEEDGFVAERFGISLDSGNAAGSNEAAGLCVALVAVDSASTVPALPVSKNHVKFELWAASTKKLLSFFEQDGWQNASEKTVKAPLLAVAHLQIISGTAGHLAIHAECVEWIAGLGWIKKLLSLRRNVINAKKKAKLDASEKMCEEPLLATAAFLKSRGIRPATSFQLCVMRSRLVQACTTVKAVAGPFQELSSELAEIFRDAAAADVVPQAGSADGKKALAASGTIRSKVDVSLWLRSFFTDILPEIMPQAAAADKRPVQASVLHNDLAAAGDSLKDAFGEVVPAAFLSELTAVCVVLAAPAGMGKSSALAVKKALQTVRSEAMVLFAAALASPLWDLAQHSAAALVQVSSKDALATAKMERALAILRDPRLPQLDFSAAADCSERVYQADFGKDGSLMADLGESLLGAAEAQSLWSDLQAESQAALVKSWAETCCRTLAAINEVHWVCLAGCFAKAGIVFPGDTAPAETLDEFVPGVTAEGLEALETAMDALGDDQPLLRCTERLVQHFAAYSEALKATVGTDALMEEFLLPLCQSHKLRAGVFEVASALAAVPYLVDCPEALVEEWRQKHQPHGTADASQLSLILGLLRAVGTLRALPRPPGDRPSTAVVVHLRYGEGGSAEDFPVSLDTARSLDKLVLGSPFVASLDRTSQAVTQHIFNSLVLAVNLPGANFQAVAVSDPGAMEVFASFFHSNQGAELATAAARPLSQKINDSDAWPFQDCVLFPRGCPFKPPMF